jgi:hypothetical protein
LLPEVASLNSAPTNRGKHHVWSFVQIEDRDGSDCRNDVGYGRCLGECCRNQGAVVRGALDELAPVFERTTGNKLVIDYGVAAQLKERFLAGAAADVLILTRQLMDDLQKQGAVTTGRCDKFRRDSSRGSASCRRDETGHQFC